MGIINPLLAVLPLIKEGKGKDSPCNQLIAEATKLKKEAARVPRRSSTASSSDQSAASGATAPRPPSQPAR